MKALRAFLLAAFAVVSLAASAAGGYHLLKTIRVAGHGLRWDYCTTDPAARRVYLTYGNLVEVFNADTLARVGEIPNTQGAHGVAIAEELGRGFVSDGASASVTIFNLKTLATIGTVKTTGKNPDSIVYDPATRRVFTFNGGSGNSTVLDAGTGKVIGTFALGGDPEFSAADGKGRVFVNLPDSNTVLVIDSRKMEPEQRWAVAPSCTHPASMAIDLEHNRLFLGCHGVMAMLNASNGHVIATVPIGQREDAIAFDPAAHLAFSSNGEGTLTVIQQESPDRYKALETVKTEWGARTMTVDPKTHRVFLPVSDFNRNPPPSTGKGGPRHTPFSVVIPGTFRVLVFAR